MNSDNDKWREYSRRAGERLERKLAFRRFSHPMMMAAALMLIVASVFDLL